MLAAAQSDTTGTMMTHSSRISLGQRGLRVGASLLGLSLLAAPAAAETEIRVGITGNSLGFASWFLADDGGIFARNGIAAKFVFLSADAVPAALLSGGIQGTPLTESIMHAQFAGYAVRDVALTVSRPVYEVLARPGIASFQDLKGKTVIASPPKSLPTLILKYLIERAGLVPDQDVKILSIGAITARQTLILSGNGDAIIESTTSALQLREKLPDMHVLKGEADMPEQLSDGVAVSVDLIEKDPDLVMRMVRSLALANAETRAHPQWAAELLATRMGMPKHGMELAQVLIGSFPAQLTPTDALYAAEAAFMSRAAAAPVTPQQVAAAWDTRFSTAIDGEMAAIGVTAK
jgi:NitT/TauT family transport system substrate-binding protein